MLAEPGECSCTNHGLYAPPVPLTVDRLTTVSDGVSLLGWCTATASLGPAGCGRLVEQFHSPGFAPRRHSRPSQHVDTQFEENSAGLMPPPLPLTVQLSPFFPQTPGGGGAGGAEPWTQRLAGACSGPSHTRLPSEPVQHDE